MATVSRGHFFCPRSLYARNALGCLMSNASCINGIGTGETRMFSTGPGERTAFLVNESGTIETWNANCESLFGVAASQAVGQNVAVLLAPGAQAAWSGRWA